MSSTIDPNEVNTSNQVQEVMCSSSDVLLQLLSRIVQKPGYAAQVILRNDDEGRRILIYIDPHYRPTVRFKSPFTETKVD